MINLKLLGAVSVLCVTAAAGFAAEAETPVPNEAGAEQAAASEAVAGETDVSEADAEAKAVTFEACFNGGLLKNGAYVDYNVRRTGTGGSGDANFIYSVGKPVKFNGQTAIEKKLQIKHKKSTEVGYEYWTVKADVISELGLKSNGTTVTYDPAEKTSIKAKQKTPSTQTYNVEVEYGGRSDYGTIKATIEFNGVETLKTPFGSIKACKVTKKSVITPRGSKQIVATTNEVEWYAREGKYRGFLLKVNYFGRQSGENYNYTLAATKINKFVTK